MRAVVYKVADPTASVVQLRKRSLKAFDHKTSSFSHESIIQIKPFENQVHNTTNQVASMDLRHVLTKLIDKNDLSTEEVRFVREFMTPENCSENPAAVGASLALLSCKGESAQEVTTFAQCLGEKCVQIPFSVTCLFM